MGHVVCPLDFCLWNMEGGVQVSCQERGPTLRGAGHGLQWTPVLRVSTATGDGGMHVNVLWTC